jgi:hypothetical protein
LVVLVTLSCLYFGSWEATKRAGVSRVERLLDDEFRPSSETTSPLPFVVSAHVNDLDTHLDGIILLWPLERRHYFWLPGMARQLPRGFTDFIEWCEARWHDWTHNDSDHMKPQRVHGGII